MKSRIVQVVIGLVVSFVIGGISPALANGKGAIAKNVDIVEAINADIINLDIARTIVSDNNVGIIGKDIIAIEINSASRPTISKNEIAGMIQIKNIDAIGREQIGNAPEFAIATKIAKINEPGSIEIARIELIGAGIADQIGSNRVII